ncbi:MAG: hypothetical protein ACFCUI_08040 [Bernardetiaceae bacterium]
MYIQLTNSEKKVKICRKGFSFLRKNKLAEGWRLHSAGYAVLQFTQNGKIQTLYMHKILAKHFVPRPDSDKRLFVRMLNGDKLDCRVENFTWATMSELRRNQHSDPTLYRGVSRDGKKYRAVLYDKGERVYLGVFATPEEAAQAYNEESVRRFGITKSLNQIPEP